MTVVFCKVQTWDKNIDGLFDFEKIMKVQDLKISSTGQLVRGVEGARFLNSLQPLSDKDQLLLSCFNLGDQNDDTKSNYVVAFDRLTLKGESLVEQEKAYLVVRSLKNRDGTQRGYRLRVNDYIKIGRVEYFVRQIRDEENIVHKAPHKQRHGQKTLIIDPSLKLEEKEQCRICLDDKHTLSNPLVNACNCRGTINYIHIECLSECIKSRMRIKNFSNVIQYKVNSLVCELCKATYPTRVMSSASKFSLLHIEKPTSPYLMLQSVNQSSQNILIIRAETGKRVVIGRASRSQIHLNDVTVSRFHGWIEKDQENGYRLFDNASKFGTLIELRDHYRITNEPVSFQVGRSMITFNTQ